jgi:polysaccharide biosynthesis/export protein
MQSRHSNSPFEYKPVIRKFLLGVFAASALLSLPGCAPSQETTSVGGTAANAPTAVNGESAVGSISAPIGGNADQNSNELAQLWQQRTDHKSELGIGPGDVLEISVVGVDELQKQQVRVEGDGSVNLPLLGRIEVGGLSEQQFTQLLKDRLHKFVYQPDVQVFVTSYNSREVAVTGAVHSPGLLTINSPDNTLREMIQRAGGPTETAGRRILFTPGPLAPVNGIEPAAFNPIDTPDPPAQSSSPQKLLVINIEQKGNDRYLDLPVRPGDSIYVPPGGNVTIVGWVYYPKTVQVSPGLTVLQAISSAGGPLFAADQANVKLIRQNSVGAPEVFRLDLNKIENLQQADIPVRDGDVVQLPYSIARIPAYGLYFAAQSLVTFGPIALLSTGL